MLNLIFLWKDLGLASPLHFAHDFSRKIFLMLLSSLWSQKFWNEPYRSCQAVFLYKEKSQDKMQKHEIKSIFYDL